MIEIRKKTMKYNKIDYDLNLTDLIEDIAFQVEKNVYDSEYSFQQNNADVYLETIYHYLTDHLGEDFQTSTTSLVSFIHFMLVAVKAADEKDKYFHFATTEDEKAVEFGLLKKSEDMKDIRNLLKAEADDSIH